MTGLFVVVEGIDGSGKTTAVEHTAQLLSENGLKVFATKEPTTNEIGILLRKYLKRDHGIPELDTLLFAADRIEHCRKQIDPLLERGYIVITDRYKESSVVYQSVAGSVAPRWVESVNGFATEPDLLIIVDCDPHIAMERIERTRKSTEKFETLERLTKLRNKYKEIYPGALFIDGTQSPSHVVAEMYTAIVEAKIRKNVKNVPRPETN